MIAAYFLIKKQGNHRGKRLKTYPVNEPTEISCDYLCDNHPLEDKQSLTGAISECLTFEAEGVWPPALTSTA